MIAATARMARAFIWRPRAGGACTGRLFRRPGDGVPATDVALKPTAGTERGDGGRDKVVVVFDPLFKK